MRGRASALINIADLRGWAFDHLEITAILSEVGQEYAVADAEALRVDLTNDFAAFAINRASQSTFSVGTRNSIDTLTKASLKTTRLFREALTKQAEMTWLLNKAFAAWPDRAERNLLEIKCALTRLEELLKAPDMRGWKHGMSVELQFVGLTLPNTFELHFRRKYKVARKSDQRPSGPGVRFVAACLKRKQVLNSHGKPFSLETIVAHRRKALQIIKGDSRLAVTRSPVMVRMVL